MPFGGSWQDSNIAKHFGDLSLNMYRTITRGLGPKANEEAISFQRQVEVVLG